MLTTLQIGKIKKTKIEEKMDNQYAKNVIKFDINNDKYYLNSFINGATLNS